MIINMASMNQIRSYHARSPIIRRSPSTIAAFVLLSLVAILISSSPPSSPSSYSPSSLLLSACAFNGALFGSSCSMQGNPIIINSTLAYIPCNTGLQMISGSTISTINTWCASSSLAYNAASATIWSACGGNHNVPFISININTYVNTSYASSNLCKASYALAVNASSPGGNVIYASCDVYYFSSQSSVISMDPSTGNMTSLMSPTQCASSQVFAFAFDTGLLFVACYYSSSTAFGPGLGAISFNSTGGVATSTSVAHASCAQPQGAYLALGAPTIYFTCYQSVASVISIATSGATSSIVIILAASQLTYASRITQSIVTSTLYVQGSKSGIIGLRNYDSATIANLTIITVGLTACDWYGGIAVSYYNNIDNINAGCTITSSAVVTIPVQWCVLGTYTSVASPTSCFLCSYGTYSIAITVMGSATVPCQNCAIGTYQTSTGATACSSCGIGTYASSVGTVNCAPAIAGSYVSTTGVSSPPLCSIGSYSASGATICIVCGIGTFANTMGTANCTLALPGSFVNTTGASSPSLCPSGTFSTSTGSSTISSCVPCASNTYNPSIGASQCISCPLSIPHSQPSSYNVSQCSPCAGSYITTVNSITPCDTICPMGYTCINSIATACIAGTYSTTIGTSDPASCIQCAIGQYQNSTGSTICKLCVPGHYTSSYQSSMCAECSAGTMQPSMGSASCGLCPIGAYQSNTAATTCVLTPAGSYTNATGASMPSLCSIGTYNPSTNSSSCILCPVGSYANTTGSIQCISAGVGTYISYTGATSSSAALFCQLGSYAPQTGASSCIQCAAGTYADSAGQSVCNQCPQSNPNGPIGSVSSTQCGACNDVFITTGGTTAVCSTRCPAGYYCANSIATPCIVGSYNSLTGSSLISDCIVCAVGTYTSAVSAGASVCSSCNAGSYQPANSSTSCILCPANTHSSTLAAYNITQCIACSSLRPVSPQGSISSLQCVAIECAPGNWPMRGVFFPGNEHKVSNIIQA